MTSNNAAGKYDHVQLGRDFRAHVKPRLKAMAGWADYVKAQNWGGRTQSLDRAEILAACEALGFDLIKAKAEWITGVSAAAISALPAGASVVETEAALERALADAEPEAEPAMAKADEADASGAERFEGGDVEQVIAELLAPASPHMTPHLAGMMPNLIRDAVAAAVRGPRTIVKTVVQPVAADGAVIAPRVNVATVKTVPLYQAFAMRRGDCPGTHRHVWENQMMDVCDYDDPLNQIDRDYLWQPSLLAELAAQDAGGMNAWVWGAAGTGKTDGVAQYAANLKRPFIRIPIERTTEPMELIGMMVPAKGGGMVWEDGKLTRAFRIPRAVILIDEPSLLRSGTLSVLQTALDHRKLFLVTGEVVPAAPGAFIVACDNTNGTGDDTGRFVDTAALNAAFLDRFAMRTQLSFLTAAQETGMVARRVGVHANVIKPMVEYANLTRRDCDAGKLTMGVTTRRLLAWARLVKIGIKSETAFDGVVLQGAAAEDRAALMMLAGQNLTTNHVQIDGMVRGLIDVNAPTPDPKAQGNVGATALSFPDDNDTL